MSGIRLGGALKELRIHLCQTSKQSAGVREFIQQHYVNIKKENPYFPILIRECSGVQPKVYARFEKGQEVSQPLHDFSCEEVYDTIREISKITPKKGVERSTPLTDLSATDVVNSIKQLTASK